MKRYAVCKVTKGTNGPETEIIDTHDYLSQASERRLALQQMEPGKWYVVKMQIGSQDKASRFL